MTSSLPIRPDRVLSECSGKSGAERAGCEAPILEEEREAKAKEEAERPAKEAAARAAKEREIREAGERTGREAAEREAKKREEEKTLSSAPTCVVPSLKGDTLTVARRALREAHCKLGRVTPPPRGHGRHVVTHQGVRAGSKRLAGTAVSVTLGPVKLGR